MAGQEVRAYNFAASDTAALVGPSRGRLQGVLVNAAAAAAFTIRSGSATGEIILQLTLPVGWNDVYIPMTVYLLTMVVLSLPLQVLAM